MDTFKKEGSKSSSNGRPSLDQTLKPEELSKVNLGGLMKENLKIYGKKLELLSKRRLGLKLDDSC